MKRILIVLAALLVPLLGQSAWAFDDSWNMEVSGGVIQDSDNTARDMTLDVHGTFATGAYTTGANSVTFTAAPAWGDVANTADKNPGTQIVALGADVSVDLTNAPASYSGNVTQKGLFNDGQQIKLQVVRGASDEGQFQCVVTGTLASKIWTSAVPGGVADGSQHEAYCVRNGTNLKLWVDGVSYAPATSVDVGSIAPNRNLLVGNKGPSGDASDQHFGKNTCTAYAYGTGAVAYVGDTLAADNTVC